MAVQETQQIASMQVTIKSPPGVSLTHGTQFKVVEKRPPARLRLQTHFEARMRLLFTCRPQMMLAAMGLNKLPRQVAAATVALLMGKRVVSPAIVESVASALRPTIAQLRISGGFRSPFYCVISHSDGGVLGAHELLLVSLLLSSPRNSSIIADDHFLYGDGW